MSRRSLLLLTHTALGQAIVYLLRPATSYRALELGVPASWLGVLSAGFAAVPLMLAIPVGKLTDRVGERPVLVTGALTTCLAGVSFLLLGGSVAGLVFGGMLLGTGHLCAALGQQSLVANTVSAGRYDAAFGYYAFAASLGQAVGPLLIVLLGGNAAIPATGPIFAGAIVLAAVFLGCALLLHDDTARRQRDGAAPARVGDLLRMPGVLRALVASSAVLAAVDIVVVYLPALGAERGVAAGVVGLLLGLRAVAAMISRLLVGRLARALGRRALLMTSVLAGAVGLGVAAAPVPVWLLAVAVACAGFGLGMGQPVTMSSLAEAAVPGLRGRAMSLRLTGNRAGQVLMPSLAGFTALALGASGVLGLTAAGLGVLGYVARRVGSG